MQDFFSQSQAKKQLKNDPPQWALERIKEAKEKKLKELDLSTELELLGMMGDFFSHGGKNVKKQEKLLEVISKTVSQEDNHAAE